MTLVHPGGPSPGRSLGASRGTSPTGTSPSGSSAASTGHNFADRRPPIKLVEISGSPRPRLQSSRAFRLEILCVSLLICRYLHVATCVSLLDHLCMASMNFYIFLCMALEMDFCVSHL
jgi:hypothetical protein